MSSLSDMWSNPITRNQRRPPPPMTPARSRSVTVKSSRSGARESKSGRSVSFATNPAAEHRRRHSALATRSSETLVGSSSDAEGGAHERGRRGRYSPPFLGDYATVREELPPPALPILHSSSGSEDEGFGPENEMMMFRLRLLAASPSMSRAAKSHAKPPAKPSIAHSTRGPPSPSAMPPPLHRTAAGRVRGSSPDPPPSPPPPPALPSPLSTRSEPGDGWGASTAGGKGGMIDVPGGNGQGPYFFNQRLHETLALIRSGQAFCSETHIAVDFVRRAKVAGKGVTAQARVVESDLLRHALLLTDAALYMLEVRLLPRSKPAGEPGPRRSDHTGYSSKAHAPALDPGSGGSPALASPDSSSTSVESLRLERSRGRSDARAGDRPRNGRIAWRDGRAGGERGGVGGTGGWGTEKKIRSIQMMERLLPEQLLRVSLPFREVALRNGDVVARRGCGIVLHTRMDGQMDHVWLKCRSNPDRGALVEALVKWFEANREGAELNVQQVPETPLVAHLARQADKRPSRPERLKDTDCTIA